MPTTVTGTIVYWITRIATSVVIVAAILAALFYLGRGAVRMLRRLFRPGPPG